MPDDEHRSDSELYIHADTAWFTTITGHNDYAASSFVSRTGLPMIMVGAEHGTNGHRYPRELLRLPRTSRQSQSISLAKSAQSSQLIASELQQWYDLPSAMIKTGESRGAMLAAGHLPYAEHYGNTIPYIDVTAPCLPTRLFSERADILRIAGWPTSELLGTIALGAELNRQRILKRHMGTVVLNPNFVLSNVKGVGPALFSGEGGRFARWVPSDVGRTALYISTFKNDTVSRPDVWRDLYKYNPNVFIREHPGGTHMTLAHDEVLETKAVRFNAFQDQYKTKLPLTAEGFDTIINTRRKGERDYFYKQPVPQESVA